MQKCMQLKSLAEISNFQIVELLKSVVQGESCYNFQRILSACDGRRRYSQQTVSHLAGHGSCRHKENMLESQKKIFVRDAQKHHSNTEIKYLFIQTQLLSCPSKAISR